ncbi:hypothetical protein EGW08_012371, partial [Elysia chlorotica]
NSSIADSVDTEVTSSQNLETETSRDNYKNSAENKPSVADAHIVNPGAGYRSLLRETLTNTGSDNHNMDKSDDSYPAEREDAGNEMRVCLVESIDCNDKYAENIRHPNTFSEAGVVVKNFVQGSGQIQNTDEIIEADATNTLSPATGEYFQVKSDGKEVCYAEKCEAFTAETDANLEMLADKLKDETGNVCENSRESKVVSSSGPGRPVVKVKKISSSRSFALSGFLEQLQVENEALSSLAQAKMKILNCRNAHSDTDVTVSDNPQEEEDNVEIPCESNTKQMFTDTCSKSVVYNKPGQNTSPSKLKTVGKIPELIPVDPAVENESEGYTNEKMKTYSRIRLNRLLKSHTKHQPEREMVKDGEKRSEELPVKSKDADGVAGIKDFIGKPNSENILDSGLTESLTANGDPRKLDSDSHSEDDGGSSKESKPFLMETHQFQPQSSFLDLERSFQMSSKRCDGKEEIPLSGSTIFQNAQFCSDDPPYLQDHCKTELKRLEAFEAWWTDRREKAAEERMKSDNEEILTPVKQDHNVTSELVTPPRSQQMQHFPSEGASSFEKALFKHVKARNEINVKRNDQEEQSSASGLLKQDLKENRIVGSSGEVHQHRISLTHSKSVDGERRRTVREDTNAECKQLDDMHEAMLRRRKLTKAAKKRDSVEGGHLTDLKSSAHGGETFVTQEAPCKNSQVTSKQKSLELSDSSQFLAEDHDRATFDFLKNRTNNATQKESDEKFVIQKYDQIEDTSKIRPQIVNVKKATNYIEDNDSKMYAEPLKSIQEFVIEDQTGGACEKALLNNDVIAGLGTPSTANTSHRPELRKSAKKSLTPLFDAVHKKQLTSHEGKSQPRKLKFTGETSNRNYRPPLRTLFTAEPEMLDTGNLEKSKYETPSSGIEDQMENCIKGKRPIQKNHNGVRNQTRQKKTVESESDGFMEELGHRNRGKKYVASRDAAPRKPSKSEARLAGLEVSDGPTSSSSSSSFQSSSRQESSAGGDSETDPDSKAYGRAANEGKDVEDVGSESDSTDSSGLKDSADDALAEELAYYRGYPSHLSSQYQNWYHYQSQSHPCWLPYLYHHWSGPHQPPMQGNHRYRSQGPSTSSPSSFADIYRFWYPYSHYCHPYYYGNYYPSPLVHPPYSYQDNPGGLQTKLSTKSHRAGSFSPSLDAYVSLQWKYVCHMTKHSVRLAKKMEKSLKKRSS